MNQELSRLLHDDDAQDPRRDAYIALIAEFQTAIHTSRPRHWWRRACIVLLDWQRRPDRIAPEIREYAASQATLALEALRQHARETRRLPAKDDDGRARRAQDVIHLIAHAIHLPPRNPNPFTLRRISFSEIADTAPHRMRYEPDGETPHVLVRADRRSRRWVRIDLSRLTEVMHKGGAARVILKIAAGSPANLLRAELPPNDIDIIACGHRATATSEAMRLGSDAGGIEWVDSFDDLAKLMAGRDLDINQCFLSTDALLCTEEALAAARTGKISHKAEDRGLYGTDVLYYEGEHLVKNRGVYRLVKFLAERKARSFEFNRLNEQLDFGIYWLVLVRKISRKKDAGRLLNRLYELARRISQLRPGEQTVYDALDRVHAEFPFFNFDDAALDEVGVAHWLSGKLARLADRMFRQSHAIPIGLQLDRCDGDMTPYLVTLDGYVDDLARDRQTAEAWSAFLERCRARTAAAS